MKNYDCKIEELFEAKVKKIEKQFEDKISSWDNL